MSFYEWMSFQDKGWFQSAFSKMWSAAHIFQVGLSFLSISNKGSLPHKADYTHIVSPAELYSFNLKQRFPTQKAERATTDSCVDNQRRRSCPRHLTLILSIQILLVHLYLLVFLRMSFQVLESSQSALSKRWLTAQSLFSHLNEYLFRTQTEVS